MVPLFLEDLPPVALLLRAEKRRVVLVVARGSSRCLVASEASCNSTVPEHFLFGVLDLLSVEADRLCGGAKDLLGVLD